MTKDKKHTHLLFPDWSVCGLCYTRAVLSSRLSLKIIPVDNKEGARVYLHNTLSRIRALCHEVCTGIKARKIEDT